MDDLWRIRLDDRIEKQRSNYNFVQEKRVKKAAFLQSFYAPYKCRPDFWSEERQQTRYSLAAE